MDADRMLEDVVDRFGIINMDEKDLADITSSIMYARLGFRRGSESMEYLAKKYQDKPYHVAVAGALFGLMKASGGFNP